MIAPQGPVIVEAGLGPGHDGRAELVVELRYPSGARRSVSLAEEAVTDALDAAGVASAEELIGRPWTVLMAGARGRP